MVVHLAGGLTQHDRNPHGVALTGRQVPHELACSDAGARDVVLQQRVGPKCLQASQHVIAVKEFVGGPDFANRVENRTPHQPWLPTLLPSRSCFHSPTAIQPGVMCLRSVAVTSLRAMS